MDRLAVRTYVSPFDAVVCARRCCAISRGRASMSYLPLQTLSCGGVSPQLRAGSEIHHRAWTDGARRNRRQDECLLRWKIRCAGFDNHCRSGLDIPTANALVHRADMFGLAQLYQLRGRVGRSKARAYAYLTAPEPHPDACCRSACVCCNRLMRWGRLHPGKP